MQSIPAEIIAIGDELLYGQTLDTNSQWLCTALTQLGAQVVQRTTVGEEEEAILGALDAAEQRATIILLTGGLGPTADDLTRGVLARYLHRPLVLHEQGLADMQAAFQRRGLTMPANNKPQAMLPAGGTLMRNLLGTAPGMWLEKQGKVFVALPGVPYAMKKMVTATVLPRLKAQFALPIIYQKLIHTVGIAESWLADKLQDWAQQLPSHIQLAYLPRLGTVQLKLTATGKERSQLEEEVATQIQKLMPLAGEYIYGYDEDTLEAVVGQLLQAQGKTLALAESCTGGYVSHMLTRVPGSAAYYCGGVTAYQNKVKINVLGVQATTIAQHTAVSKETAVAMAQQVRKKLQSDIGLATTGLAGPGGGNAQKPVGTVWIAQADAHTTQAQKLQLGTDRWQNIQLAAVALLDLARKALLQAD